MGVEMPRNWGDDEQGLPQDDGGPVVIAMVFMCFWGFLLG